jgi:Ca2+-transporting ATPase
MPLPLLPLQILWMNLATDGLPALALGVEPAEPDIMQRPPRKTNESIFAGGVGIDVIWVGLLMAALSLGIGYWAWSQNPEGPWRTLVFTTMTLCQLMHALAVRSEHQNFWQLNWLSNKALLAAVAAMFAAQMAITYVPFLQEIFKTEPLSASLLLLCLGLSSVVFFAVETEKFFLKPKV